MYCVDKQNGDNDDHNKTSTCLIIFKLIFLAFNFLFAAIVFINRTAESLVRLIKTLKKRKTYWYYSHLAVVTPS